MAMTFIQELIIAIIQAILEWLPVSSEGFIVLTSVTLFNESPLYALRIAIYFHLGTAIAVFFKYWKTYLKALYEDFETLRLLIITTVFTGITGVPIYLALKESFSVTNGMLVTLFIGFALIITGIILKTGKSLAIDKLTYNERKIIDEIGLGIFQGFAILPGISRSGTTITYLLLRGYKKEDAFMISFLVSLPAVLAAIVFDFIVEDTTFIFSIEYVFLMFLVAIVGYITMNVLLLFARKTSFEKICVALGLITIVLVSIYYFLA